MTAWRMLAGILVLACGVEAGSWLALKVWFMVSPSDNPSVVEYMHRGHPLLTNNEDLRATGLGVLFDPYVGFRLLPSHAEPRINPQFRSVIETDSAGFVHNGDRDVNPRLLADPTAKIYRILVLGSSAVYGSAATTNAATIPARLEARMKTRWPQVPIHVINAAVPAYISTQERLLYELYLRRIKPDAVIEVTGNVDAQHNALIQTWTPHWQDGFVFTEERYLDSFRPAASARHFLAGLVEFPEPLYSLAVLHRLMARFAGGPAIAGPQRAYFYHPEAAVQFSDNMEGLARVLIADGTLGLFALQPHLGGKHAELGEFERDVLAHDRGWAEATQRHQSDFEAVFRALAVRHAKDRLAFIDFSDAFDGVPGQTFENLSHTTDDGNDLLAQRLLERFGPILEADLAAKGWLK